MSRLIYIDSILNWKLTKTDSTITAICNRLAIEVIATDYPNLFAAMNREVSVLFNELYDTGKLAKYVHDHGLAIRVMDHDEKQISCVAAPVVLEQKEKKQ